MVYFMMSRFLGYWKKYIITRPETFHKVCVQEKRVYSDGKYAHGVFISDCKMKICSLSSTAHISPYHLNLEFPLMLTKTSPLSIFAHIFYKRDQPHLQGFESISNTMIRSKTKSLFWGNGKTHVMVMQKKDKSNSPFRNFIKSCFTLIWILQSCS